MQEVGSQQARDRAEELRRAAGGDEGGERVLRYGWAGLGLGLGWGWVGGDEQRACRPRPEAFMRGGTAVSVEWAPWA